MVYLILKMRPVENNVLFLSRQGDYLSKNMMLLHDYIEQNQPEMTVYTVCYKGRNSFKGMLMSLKNILKTMFYLSVSRVCIIDGYNYPVSILKHRQELKVYQIWHALIALKKFGHQIIDKPNGCSRRMAKALHMHENYDYAIIAGEGNRKYFAEAFNMDEDKVIPLGAPILDYLREPPPDDIFIRYPQLKSKTTILYAPTFRKGGRIDYKAMIDGIDLSLYNLVIKQHPLDVQVIKDDRVILDKEFLTEDFVKVSDIVITDYSAISAVAAFLDKKLLFYVPDLDEYVGKQGLNIDIRNIFPRLCFVNIKDVVNDVVSSKSLNQDTKNYDIFLNRKNNNNVESIYNFINSGVVVNQ